MAVTKDQKLVWGETMGPQNQLQAAPVGALEEIYAGTVAVISGGVGATAGYLKNAASADVADKCIGWVEGPAGGTAPSWESPFVGGAADGDVYLNVRPGVALIKSATAGDALDETTAGATVYYDGETTVPIAAKTSGGGTRPVLGVQLPSPIGTPDGYVFVRVGV